MLQSMRFMLAAQAFVPCRLVFDGADTVQVKMTAQKYRRVSDEWNFA